MLCDMSGRKVLRSECRQTWDGFLVHHSYYEPRHPLDLQKPPPVEKTPHDTRNYDDVFINWGDVTADSL